MSMTTDGLEPGLQADWTSGGFRLQERHQVLRSAIERRLSDLIPDENVDPQPLHQSMRYSLLSGGKRLRPLLTLQVASDLGGSVDDALDSACAIEMIHAASLILDDLPCMDDASLRRGRPANHLVFGEDTAILAATALLNRAFGVVAECERLPAEVRIGLTRLLSDAVGSDGIIAGQLSDLRSKRGNQDDAVGLARMYVQKTGALFVAALEAGARVAGVDEIAVGAVREYGTNLGLAFQLLDDLLDSHSTPDASGKDIGQDRDASLANRLGASGARREVYRYVETAASALEPLGSSGRPLAELARIYTKTTMERVVFF